MARNDTKHLTPYIIFCIWPIALLPKTFQLLTLFIIVIALLIFSRKKIAYFKFEDGEYSLFAFILIYIFSFFINVNYAEDTRILATINTISIWIIALILYFIYRNIIIDYKTISIIALSNMLIMDCLAFIYYLLPSFSPIFAGRPLVGSDWMDGDETRRFFAFFEYPNLVTAFCLIFFPLSLYACVTLFGKIISYIYCFAALAPICASASRAGILVSIVMVIIGIAYIRSTSRHLIISNRAILILAFLFLILILITSYSQLIHKIEQLFYSREGSNSARFSLYKVSLSTMFTRSPVFGCGIKDTIPEFGTEIPLGSHSTYIGVLYKTGIIGAILFFIALIVIIKHILNNISTIYTCIFILCALVFFIFEDMDGANWLLCSLMCVAGVLSNKNISISNGGVVK